MDKKEKLKKRLREEYRFYYKPVRKSTRVVGGTWYNADIFKAVNNKLEKVGQTRWNNAFSKGDKSEVYTELKNLGLIPEKIQKAKKDSNYYGWSDKDDYGLYIEEI